MGLIFQKSFRLCTWIHITGQEIKLFRWGKKLLTKTILWKTLIVFLPATPAVIMDIFRIVISTPAWNCYDLHMTIWPIILTFGAVHKRRCLKNGFFFVFFSTTGTTTGAIDESFLEKEGSKVKTNWWGLRMYLVIGNWSKS